MRERLEAFKTNGEGDEGTEEGNVSGGGGAKEPKTSLTAGVIEPDQKFHQKLMAFRKISEGKLDAPREPLKPKPPQSISSLLARVSFFLMYSEHHTVDNGKIRRRQNIHDLFLLISII